MAACLEGDFQPVCATQFNHKRETQDWSNRLGKAGLL